MEQDRLIELFKSAQVGACVNGVAHDVNNLLGAIMAYAELVAADSPLTDESRRMMHELMGAVRRSTALLGTLTCIARKEKPNECWVDVAELLNRTLQLRQHDLKGLRAQVKVDCQNSVGTILGDEPKLVRALVYLLLNAMEAVEPLPVRHITLWARSGGGFVEIGVQNDGEPLPEHVRTKLFTPFFTTKGPGHVGLGLAQAREIARIHRGDLNYDPERGFVMRLPREGGTVQAEAAS